MHFHVFVRGHWPQLYSTRDRLVTKCYWGDVNMQNMEAERRRRAVRLQGRGLIQAPLALRFPVHVLHVDFEVVVAGELLVAQLALRHGPVGVVRELMSAEHLLQAERQVANLPDRQNTDTWGAARRSHVAEPPPKPNIQHK